MVKKSVAKKKSEWFDKVNLNEQTNSRCKKYSHRKESNAKKQQNNRSPPQTTNPIVMAPIKI